jgi:SAM-dependent methyltransferase
VLDLAAGTGILSGQLRRAGMWVLALEPVPEMLEHLTRTLPTVPAVRAVAERLPVCDDAVDTVTVGEAFHWFDAPVVLGEAHRVLRPGGLLAVARNVRDDSFDWVARYDEAVTSELPDGRPYRHDAGLDAALVAVDGFVDGQVLRSPNPRPSGPPMLVDRAASTSFVANAAPDARARVLDRVRELVATHPDLAGRPTFELPYVTELRTWQAV